MIANQWRPLVLVGLGFVLGVVYSHLPDSAASGQGDGKSGPKPRTEHTKKPNADFATKLNNAAKRDFEFAQGGLIAPLPNEGVVKNAKDQIVWDPRHYSFIKTDKTAPDSVNPSLWRVAQVLAITGLFKVTDQ